MRTRKTGAKRKQQGVLSRKSPFARIKEEHLLSRLAREAEMLAGHEAGRFSARAYVEALDMEARDIMHRIKDKQALRRYAPIAQLKAERISHLFLVQRYGHLLSAEQQHLINREMPTWWEQTFCIGHEYSELNNEYQENDMNR